MEEQKTNTQKEQSAEQPAEPKYTKEQLAEMRASTIKYYTEQTKVLDAQVKYAKVAAELEELNLRKLMAVAQQAQIMYQPEAAPPPDDELTDEEKYPMGSSFPPPPDSDELTEKETEFPPKKRSLKREE